MLVCRTYASDSDSEIRVPTVSQQLSFKSRTLRRKLNVSLAPNDFHQSQLKSVVRARSIAGQFKRRWVKHFHSNSVGVPSATRATGRWPQCPFHWLAHHKCHLYLMKLFNKCFHTYDLLSNSIRIFQHLHGSVWALSLTRATAVCRGYSHGSHGDWGNRVMQFWEGPESGPDPDLPRHPLASTGPQSHRLHQNDLCECGSHTGIVWTKYRDTYLQTQRCVL